MTIHANFGSFFSGKLGNSHTGGDGNRFPQRMKLLLLGSKMFHYPLYVQRCLWPTLVKIRIRQFGLSKIVD